MKSTYHSISTDRFYADLVGGQLHGVTAGPALTRDAYELYTIWCDRKRIPALASPPHFVRKLSERNNVPALRKCYVLGDKVMGPHSVLYFATPASARTGFEYEWLGAHLARFNTAVSIYRAVGQHSPANV